MPTTKKNTHTVAECGKARATAKKQLNNAYSQLKCGFTATAYVDSCNGRRASQIGPRVAGGEHAFDHAYMQL